MKISLVYPIWKRNFEVEPALRDLKSFFSKFPLEIEVILVFDPPWTAEFKDKLNEVAVALQTEEKFSLRLLWNPKTLYRGGSVLKGLKQATGEILYVGSIDLSSPLSETFSLISELISRKADLVIGNQKSMGRKKKNGLQKNWLHSQAEKILARSLSKKWPDTPDSTSGIFVLSRPAFSDISDKLVLAKWFYTQNILEAMAHKKRSWHSVDILVINRTKSRFSIFRSF